MLSDGELLRRYAESDSEEAFTALVQRHIHVVYHTALRRVGGNAHCADDVTQKVFNDLARKAKSLADRPSLAGWLYTGARFAAADAVRAERRRRIHEQEAQTMNELNGPAPIAAERIDPFLDEVMDLLPERDREAVLLHFFEGRTFVEVGAMLSLTADGARMRVNRALERLRGALAQRGIASSAAALGAVLLGQSALAAPASLATAVAGHAIAHASTLSAGAPMVARLIHAAKVSPSTPWLAGVAAVVLVGLAVYSTEVGTDAPESTLIHSPAYSNVDQPAPSSTGVVVGIEQLETTREEVAAPVAPVPLPSAAKPTMNRGGFAALSTEEKSILKQLWTRENALALPPGTRFGIDVAPHAPRFEQFEAGRARLLQRGWVGIGAQKGLTHLTNAGRIFCEAHRDEIEAYSQFYGAAKGD